MNSTDDTKLIWRAINSKVPWIVFTFVVALFLAGIGWTLTGVSGVGSRVDAVDEKAASNEVDLRGVEVRQDTQFAEIMRSLKRIENGK